MDRRKPLNRHFSGKICITPVLMSLHWLPNKYQIQYKIALLTFKCLNNLAPSYLADLLIPYAPTRSLRSADERLLCERAAKRVRYGEHAFSFAAPKTWNSLPRQLQFCDSNNVFKQNLKTQLF